MGEDNRRPFTTEDTEERGTTELRRTAANAIWEQVGDGKKTTSVCGSSDGAHGGEVRAKKHAGGTAEPGDSGELRLGDQAAGVRCAGESAEVQEGTSEVSERLRGNCGGEEVRVGISDWRFRLLIEPQRNTERAKA